MSASLLVELFTEELPPKALKRLGEVFADGVLSGLSKARLVNADTKPQVYATPRRLAVLIPNVSPKAEDKLESKKLMPAKVAFDAAGMPTTALTKRLEKDGASSNQLSRKTEGGNEFVYLSQTMPGVMLSAGLQGVLEDTIAKLPIPKVMSYQLPGSTETIKFVRPAHGLVALHGSEVVGVQALGLTAGRATHGHRFLGSRDIELKNASEYEARLKSEGKVIASFDTRRLNIDVQLKAKAAELGCALGEYENLLDEVTALVEWPVVYVAGFDPEFLSVPQECLILTMRTNQKYFPLFDQAGKLTERFLVVSNMEVADPVNIIEGNKRVVRPRLADARFFYEQDRKVRLETRVPALGKVVYHNKLGTQLERVERIQLLAGKIARLTGADPLLAERAAWLSKADLQTGMVGEFPELQGIMGRYYAQHDKEPEAVSNAIEAHYRPRFSGDALPQDQVSCAVALADKLDTMAGLFGVGQQPTGEKDPFGLRRAALGVLRILIEQAYPIHLPELVKAAFAGYDKRIGDAHTDLEMFLFDRLAGLLRDRKYSPQEIEAVLCMQPTRIDLVLPQLDAVRAFLALPEAPSLAAANKRVANILRQAAAKDESFINADMAHLKEPAERALFDALQSVSKRAHTLFNQGDFTGYLTTFAALKSPVDAFFDAVMVMVEDADLRRNRLALLADLQAAMNRVADISKLAA
jgi:glycyl-tRNA synthetase beta chain